jgi:serine/threonine protein kinase
LSAGYTALAALLVATGAVKLMATLLPFQLLLLFLILYTMGTAIRAALRGDADARIFTAGFISASLFAAYDVLAAMGVLPRTRLALSQYGHGTFCIALGAILVRRFLRVYFDRAVAEQRIGEQAALLQAAAQLAAGDLSTPIQVAAQSSLGPLASGLDSMRRDLQQKLQVLEERNTEIQQLNDELRRQIEQRSRRLVEALVGAESDSSAEVIPIYPPGYLLAGRYRIVEVLGQGAMGTVYEVTRITDGRAFAAKVLSGAIRRQSMARFAREAQLLARLKHPNLIGIIDADITDRDGNSSDGSDGRLAYLIMELVRGQNLAQLSSRFGDSQFALPILHQIADALATVHAGGIVHRDLKPANVLVASATESGRLVVKLADFGVSRLLVDTGGPMGGPDSLPPLELSDTSASLPVPSAYEQTLQDVRTASSAPLSPSGGGGSATITVERPGDGAAERNRITARLPRTPNPSPDLTLAGAIIGTPLYMAPELAQGAQRALPAADVFSFGVIAYELLTGELPFEEPPMMLSLAIRRSSRMVYEPLSKRCPQLPEKVQQLLSRCLSGRPEMRPTAKELAAALAETLPGRIRES